MSEPPRLKVQPQTPQEAGAASDAAASVQPQTRFDIFQPQTRFDILQPQTRFDIFRRQQLSAASVQPQTPLGSISAFVFRFKDASRQQPSAHTSAPHRCPIGR